MDYILLLLLLLLLLLFINININIGNYSWNSWNLPPKIKNKLKVKIKERKIKIKSFVAFLCRLTAAQSLYSIWLQKKNWAWFKCGPIDFLNSYGETMFILLLPTGQSTTVKSIWELTWKGTWVIEHIFN